MSFLSVNAQNKTLFFQTNWGYEGSWAEFFEDVKQSGYEGIEVWLPSDPKIQDTLIMGLKAHDLKVIYLCGTHRGRFSYSLPETLRYLENDTLFRINLDVSHWMVVH